MNNTLVSFVKDELNKKFLTKSLYLSFLYLVSLLIILFKCMFIFSGFNLWY